MTSVDNKKRTLIGACLILGLLIWSGSVMAQADNPSPTPPSASRPRGDRQYALPQGRSVAPSTETGSVSKKVIVLPSEENNETKQIILEPASRSANTVKVIHLEQTPKALTSKSLDQKSSALSSKPQTKRYAKPSKTKTAN